MSDDDDDFGPALPITLLARKRPRDDVEGEAKNAPFQDATDPTATITTADSVTLRSQQVALPTAVPPPLSPTMLSQKQDHPAVAAGTPPTAPTTTTTPIQSSKATAGSGSSVWNVPLFDDIYGECYERSYRHENQNNHDNWITSVAVVQASGGSGTHSRHFVATLDAAGTLRWWVKTPRGFFYVRSLSLWPSTSPSASAILTATETEETAPRRRENDTTSSSSCGSGGLLLSTSEDPTLLLVCRNVKHLFHHGAGSPPPSSSEDSVVELLQISTDLLIPDSTWKVPLLRSSSQATTTTTATSSPRDKAPAMLICRGAHADTLLWFVAHPIERTISVCALRDDNTTNGRSRAVRWITVPTGTAHPLRFLAFSPPTATTTSVTASTQHKRLCFLCDEKGLIDYAAVNVKGIEEELLLDSQEGGSSPRGSLEPLWAVIPGRAAVAMTKPAPWWTSRVSFPKRPSTDFFVCLRRQLQPLALCPSLDGSQLLLVAASTTKHENEKGDMRNACAPKNYHCFVLDVPTGKLITEFSAVSARGAIIASLRPIPLVAVPAQTPTPSAVSTSAACAWLLPDMLPDPNDASDDLEDRRQPKRSVALRQHAASVVLTEKGSSSSSGSSSATGAATFLKTLYGGELPPLDPSSSSYPSPPEGAVVWDLFPAASVEPSQELKNFVTKSMFGQALSPAELSGIFAVGALRGALKSSSSSSSSASYDPYVLSVLNDRLLMFSSHPPSGVVKSGGAAPKRDFSCRAIEALCGGLTGGPNSHLLLQMDDAGHSPSSLLRENAKTNVSSLQNPLDDALDAVLVFQPHPNVAFNVQGVPYGPLLVRLKLFPHLAPLAVRNFFLLSNEDHFYDGLTFHRVIRGFMLQGGCPNGDGMGGKSRIPVVWNLSEPPSSSSLSSSTDVVSCTTEGWTRRLPPIVCSNNTNNDDENPKKEGKGSGGDEGQTRNEISDKHSNNNSHEVEDEGEMMSLSLSSSSLKCGPFRDEFATKAQMQDPILGPLLRPVVNMTDSFLLCMANCGPDMNESQFFITVAPTPYLSHKHTVLGRVWLESEEEEQSRAHFLLQQQQQQQEAAALIHAEEGVLDRPANEEGTKVVEEENKEEKQPPERDPFELFPPSHWRSNKKVHTLSSRQVLQKLSEVPVDAEDRPRRKIEIASLRVLPKRSEV